MSPTRVDFYLLASQEADARWLYACRLIEKAYQKGHRVYVLCANRSEAELLDELLWTFKDDSFIPHNLQGEGPEPPPPVHIAYDQEPKGFNDILLNLTQAIPPCFRVFKRVMELVSNEEALKEQGRVRYKEYRARGCVLHLLDLAERLMAV